MNNQAPNPTVKRKEEPQKETIESSNRGQEMCRIPQTIQGIDTLAHQQTFIYVIRIISQISVDFLLYHLYKKFVTSVFMIHILNLDDEVYTEVFDIQTLICYTAFINYNYRLIIQKANIASGIGPLNPHPDFVPGYLFYVHHKIVGRVEWNSKSKWSLPNWMSREKILHRSMHISCMGTNNNL